MTNQLSLTGELMKKPLALLLALGVPSLALASDSKPAAWTHSVQPLESVERVVMPTVDEAALKAEDERRLAETQEKALRYAAPLPVDLSPDRAGTWESLPDGRLLWRLRIQSEGARSINLGFTEYSMPRGGLLLIYSADGKHLHRPFTEADNESHGQLWTPPVFGDEMVVEVTLPASRRAELRLRLTSVNHDYRGFGRRDMEVPQSGACNIDVICPIGDPYNDQDRAVAVISTGGGTFCTGSLVNNTANDAKPFFLTAAHCGINAGNAASLVTFWNYQNSTCRVLGSSENGGPGDGQLNQFNTGSFFRAAYTPSDVTLVELDDVPLPAANVFLAGWDRTPLPGQFNATVAIHHPSTDEKRITFAPGMTESGGWPPSVPGDGSHIHAIWGTNLGVTEPGSSGSPLYTQQGRYIGQLHGGPSACGAGDLSDYYGRFSLSWTGGGTDSTRLSNWLDPIASGDIVIDGRNACTAAAPTGVSAVASAPNRITVSWDPVGGATGYNVYRAVGVCPQTSYTLVGSNVPGPSFDDNTVSGGSTYAYVVRTIATCESPESSACVSETASGACTLAPSFAGLTSVASAGTSACALNLAWSAGTTNCAGSTLTYNVYRSTTPGFTPGPANLLQNCLSGTTYSDTGVASGTPYHYVVRAEDSTTNGSGACNSGNQDTNLVYGSGAPFGPGSMTVTDNVEAGGQFWSNAGGSGANVWNIVTTLSNSPTHSWFVADPAVVTDQRLTTVTAGSIPADFVMSFFHRFNSEASGAQPQLGYDGHVLEYSLDGTTWTDILAGQGPIPANAARFTMNGYNRTISTGFQSPLLGRQAWSGDNLAFQEVRVNLADFAGHSAFFRFRFATDVSVADVGVWIDDITFRGPGACGPGAFVDLSVSTTDSPDPVVGLQPLTYTLNVSNAGPAVANDVSLQNTLPAGVTFQGASGTGWACGETGGVVTCTRPTLAVGAAPPIDIAVTAPPQGGTLTNTATVDATEDDSAPTNNSDTEETTVTAAPTADLAVDKSDGGVEARWGQSFTYTVTVSNGGPVAVTAVPVTDTLPAALTGVTWTCAASAGSSCPASGTGDINAAVDLLANGTATFTATGTVTPGTLSLVNSASVTVPSGHHDPNTANNSDSVTTVAGPIAYYTVVPCRLADTRNTHPPALLANASRDFDVVGGTCAIPADARAVHVVLTAVAPTDFGNLRLYPAGGAAPLASTINFASGHTRANNAVIPLGANGRIGVQCDMPPNSTGQTHFVLDAYGYFK
jgi:lysyl endopeptidase